MIEPPMPRIAGRRSSIGPGLTSTGSAHAFDHIVTAHHADDQLETMIMRLNRSSGVGGLAGVRARNGTVLRPLLSWRRDDLTVLALEADLPLVEDPSNSDIRFDRARLRQALSSQTIAEPQAAAPSAAGVAHPRAGHPGG